MVRDKTDIRVCCASPYGPKQFTEAREFPYSSQRKTNKNRNSATDSQLTIAKESLRNPTYQAKA